MDGLEGAGLGRLGMAGPRIRRAPAPVRVLAVASLGVLMAFVDATVVNIAFPSIERSFRHSSIGSLSWVLNAYDIRVRRVPGRGGPARRPGDGRGPGGDRRALQEWVRRNPIGDYAMQGTRCAAGSAVWRW